jgi:penicillin-binding protein 2
MLRITACAALTFSLTACEAVGSLTGGSSAPGQDGGLNILQAAQTPAQVLESFMTAWGARDYATMYGLLAPRSQQLATQPVFTQIYEAADASLGTAGVTLTGIRATEQGDTVAITYDAEIASNTFGVIVDEGRTTRLVRVDGGQWRIAWTTMDILNDYAPGTTLTSGTIRAPRGSILAVDGRPLVETGGTVATIYVTRGSIPDEAACLDTLSYAVLIQRGDLAETFADYNFETQFPVGEIDPEKLVEYQAALDENCAAVITTRTTRRYHGHGAAAHISGYIGGIPSEEVQAYQQRGYDFGELVGLGGMEAQFEEELAGGASRVLRIVEPGGLPVRELATTVGADPVDVRLTIDYDLQMVTGQALADAFNYAEGNWAGRAHSTGGAMLVMDVNTGAVLAMASYPTYDPGMFNPDTPMFFVGDTIIGLGRDVRQPFLNRVVQSSYAPASTFKIITTAAAGAENLVEPDDIFYCGRVWEGAQFGDSRPERYDWRNFEPEEANFDTGEVTMANALAASCNPFFYQMGALLYRDRGASVLTDYARRMGLGRRTGIDITVVPEAAGNLPLPIAVDVAISEAIGQADIQVTLLQMARMVASVANGGTLYQPYIVQQVGDGAETEPTVVGDIGVPDEILAEVRGGMCQAVDASAMGLTSGRRVGTAWFVFSDPDNYPAPYVVCGKTGTAQTGRIEPHGWFVAYAPADDPQIAIAGVIEYGREGSETAAPVVRRILDYYFGVPPEQIAPYPDWWFENSYVPLTIPEGSTGA